MQDQVADRIEKKRRNFPISIACRPIYRPSFTAMPEWIFKDDRRRRQCRCLSVAQETRGHSRRPVVEPSSVPTSTTNLRDVDPVPTCHRRGCDYAQLKTVAGYRASAFPVVPDVAKVNVYGVQTSASLSSSAGRGSPAWRDAPQAIFDLLAKQNAIAASAFSRRRPIASPSAFPALTAPPSPQTPVRPPFWLRRDVADEGRFQGSA